MSKQQIAIDLTPWPAGDPPSATDNCIGYLHKYGTATIRIYDGKIDGSGCGPPPPAIVWDSNACVGGSAKEWWSGNERHRDGDEPAIITETGKNEWWNRGLRHRGGDKPAVVCISKKEAGKREEWWFKGFPHRDNGEPSLVCSGVYGRARKWHFRGRPYRPDGGPTEETNDGTLLWHDLEGKLHRVGGPAVIKADGTKEWWLDGKRSNPDGPAIERPDGSKEWYLDGKKNREGDLPAVEGAKGRKEWWVNDQLHRDNDLPAIVDPELHVEQWWNRGVRHRDDYKPAIVIHAHDGFKTKCEWWEHGKPVEVVSVPARFVDPDKLAEVFGKGQ